MSEYEALHNQNDTLPLHNGEPQDRVYHLDLPNTSSLTPRWPHVSTGYAGDLRQAVRVDN
ncbi:hypothetical protein E2C01_056643 [Portunus trituberculatus]|uniref:Uncharacterized protein n=1 Tax=Portunus trituberculatus TaxID=210409 RepID=A0A5B7GZQ8_PORTR|nr:hypothetical protein [Portunus trituberculatus]